MTSLLSYHFLNSRQGLFAGSDQDVNYNHRPRLVKGSTNPGQKLQTDGKNRQLEVIIFHAEAYCTPARRGYQGGPASGFPTAADAIFSCLIFLSMFVRASHWWTTKYTNYTKKDKLAATDGTRKSGRLHAPRVHSPFDPLLSFESFVVVLLS